MLKRVNSKESFELTKKQAKHSLKEKKILLLFFVLLADKLLNYYINFVDTVNLDIDLITPQWY